MENKSILLWLSEGTTMSLDDKDVRAKVVLTEILMNQLSLEENQEENECHYI